MTVDTSSLSTTVSPGSLARMALCLATVVGGAFVSVSSAALPDMPRAIFSSSGQFVIHDIRTNQPPMRRPAVRAQSTNATVRLEPETLAMAAERVKQTFLRQLNLADRGATRVHLALARSRVPDQDIGMVSTLHPDGWRYWLEIPEEVEPTKLVRGLTRVLLLEYANRTANNKSAEVPLWLSEGLVAEIAATTGPELVPQSVPDGWMRRTTRHLKGIDALQAARIHLRTNPAPSFSDITLPSPEIMKLENLKLFQSTAHLVVHQLAGLTNGPARIASMLGALPHCWNWQTAFLNAFQPEFPRMLDVEKWWALTVVEFTGRDPAQVWPLDLVMNKLEELLTATVQVRASTNDLPMRAEYPLARVVAEWDFPQQAAWIQAKLGQLAALRLNSPLQGVELIDEYRVALTRYVQNRDEVEKMPDNRRRVAGRGRILANEFLKEIAVLDRKRASLQAAPISTAAASVK